MMEKPERYIQAFADCGAVSITVHAEASTHLHRTIQSIHAAGARAGVALNPATPLSVLDYVLEDIDMVLIMTVNPGFGGQSYIPAMTGKIRTLRELASKKNPDLLIEVDGGVNTSTIRHRLRSRCKCLCRRLRRILRRPDRKGEGAAGGDEGVYGILTAYYYTKSRKDL